MMRRRRDFSRKAFTSVLVAIAFAARVAAAQELAVVRTFASEQEVTGLTEAIALWNELLPCSGPTWVPVDLLLVYSQNFDLTPSALVAAKEVQSSFENGTAWAPCFRSVFIESANLSATEDVYDNRGYAIRKDWVNGPNSVFRFILGSFFNGTFPATYDSFYFMEIDAVPVRPFWLDQFIAEATIYPRAAIRGSRYRGDSWDSFQTFLPDDLLLHINGNAIYNLRHPWLRWLYEQLEEEQSTEFNAIAFDLRMANLSLEGRE
ncbi:CSMD1, partial [Symbiodinium natans]